MIKREEKNMRKKIVTLAFGLALVIGTACFAFAAVTLDNVTLSGDKTKDSTLYNSDIKVEYAFSDAEDAKEVQLLLGGKRVATKACTPEQAADGSFSVIDEQLLTEKILAENEPKNYEYELTVKAICKGGDEISRTEKFKADASVPEVKVEGIDDGKTYDAPVDLKISVTDKNIENAIFDVSVKKDGTVIASKEDLSAKDDVFEWKTAVDGIYEIIVSSTDKGENTVTKNYHFGVNQNGPTIKDVKVTGSKASGCEVFNGGADVEISADIHETPSTIEKVQLYINKDLVKEMVLSNKKSSDEKLVQALGKAWFKENESSDGTYEYKIVATDAGGKISEAEGTFKADVIAPVVKLNGVKDGDCVSSRPEIEITKEDNYHNDTLSFEVTCNGKSIHKEQVKDRDSVTFKDFEAEGTYQIDAYSVDEAQNRSNVISASFVFDETKPVIGSQKESMTFNGHRKEEAIWFDDSVEICSSVTDALSKLEKISVTVNGKSVYSKDDLDEASHEIKLSDVLKKEWFVENESKDGEYIVTITAQDKAGNVATETSSFFADVSVPEISLTGIKEGSFTNENPKMIAKTKDNYLENNMIAFVIEKDGSEVDRFFSSESEYLYDSFDEDGKYTVKVWSYDKANNQSEVKTVSFTKDTRSPELGEVSIGGHKKSEDKWYDDSVTINTSVSEETDVLDTLKVNINGICVLDGKNVSVKDIGNSIKAELDKAWFKKNESKDGGYDIEIIAKDRAGNPSYAIGSFNADVIAPTLEMSGIKEGTFTNKDPVIKVKAKDNYEDKVSIAFKVTRDGGAYVGSVEPAKAYEFSDFHVDGEYEITAYAVDKAGNVSEEKTIRFTKDTQKPSFGSGSQPIKVDGHRKEGYQWYDADITIESPISDSTDILRSLDIEVNGKSVYSKENVSTTAMNELVKTMLSKSWFKENESEDGKYDIKITASDRAGNIATKTRAFFADVTVPEIDLTGIEEGTFTKNTPAIVANVTDNYKDKNTIFYAVTRDKKEHYTKETVGATHRYEGFNKDGDYIVRVYAVDKAGNRSTVKELSFTKDTTAPVLDLTGAVEGSYSQGTKTISAHIKERNYETVTVDASIEKTLDGKNSSIGFGSIKPNKVDYIQSKLLKETGTYTVKLSAVDKAGNKATPKTLSFTIDNDKPIVEITGVAKENGYKSSVTPKVTWEDSYFAKKSISLTRADGKTAKVSFKDSDTAKGGVRTYSNFAKIASNDGTYTLTCKVEDKAGNTETKTTTFAVNRFGSVYDVKGISKKLNGSYINDLDTDIQITEKNVTGLDQYKTFVTKDGVKQETEVDVTKGSAKGWKTYRYSFGKELFAAEGAYELNISSKDTVGNFSEFVKDNDEFILYIDKTAPVISITGIEEGGSYKGAESIVTVNVKDSIKLSDYIVTCDGKTVYDSTQEKDLTESKKLVLPSGLNQNIEVVAHDAAGNTGKVVVANVTISNNFFLRLWSNKPLFVGICAVVILAACGGVFLVRRKKKSA